ncbi:MAG: hypothetical protein ACRD2E_14120, partial [Terriglobales bacterium]
MYQGPKLIPKPMLKQSLTPGLVQMVSILAMNKTELEEAIAQELLENPLLDEAQEDGPAPPDLGQLEEELHRAPADGEVLAAVDGAAQDGEREWRDEAVASPEFRPDGDAAAAAPEAPVDPFEDIDLGSFFDDYLDPGYTGGEREEIERPSFENFLSSPTGLSEHLRWQLGSSPATPALREAAEAVIGNLDEDGYLTAEDDGGRRPLRLEELAELEGLAMPLLREALALLHSFDPPGVAARDLRECLLLQLRRLPVVNALALTLVSEHLPGLQNRQYKEIARATGVPLEEVMAALECVKKLDPYPGRQHNKSQPRLIEPDVYFVKGRDQRCAVCDREDCPNRYRVVTNDDGLPQLRLNRHYRAMKWDRQQRDVAKYIRDRYASAVQFLRNLEQRKQTIARVCHSIIARQAEFLDQGMDQLKPMMIKDV